MAGEDVRLTMDLAELRRRAFSRTGTDDDLRALAEAEAGVKAGMTAGMTAASDPTAGGAETGSSEEEVDELPAEDDEAPARRARSPLWTVGAGILGVLLGFVIGATVAGPQTPAEPGATPRPSSLEIFDRADARSPDALPLTTFEESGFEEIETRFLQQVDGGSVYASRVASDVVNYAVSAGGVATTREAVETLVCLVYARPARGDAWDDRTVDTWACTSVDAFARDGLELASGSLSFRWGPTGDTLGVSGTVA